MGITSIKLSKFKETFAKHITTAIPLIFNFQSFKSLGRFYSVYPLGKNATKLQTLIDNGIWLLLVTNGLTIIVPMFAFICRSTSDVALFLNSMVELFILLEVLILIVFCKMQKSRLQMLFEICEDAVKNVDVSTVSIFTKISPKYILAYGVILFMHFVVLVLYLYRSFMSEPMRLPLSTYYPPWFVSSTVWVILYLQQLISIPYSFVILYGDFVVSILLFFMTSEIRVLKSEFKNAKNYAELSVCIRKHQYIIWFVHETNYVVRFIVVKSIVGLAISLIIEGLQLLTIKVSNIIRLEFLLLFSLGYLRIYMYSLCAENLTQLAYDMGNAIYATQWYNQSRKIIIAKSIIICRCQRPLTISVPGIVPSLDMRYLGRFLYLVFSYTMTLRAITKG